MINGCKFVCIFQCVIFSLRGKAAGTWQRCLTCSLWQLPISYSLSFVWPEKKISSAGQQALVHSPPIHAPPHPQATFTLEVYTQSHRYLLCLLMQMHFQGNRNTFVHIQKHTHTAQTKVTSANFKIGLSSMTPGTLSTADVTCQLGQMHRR